jgi:hypothetical protein
LDADCHAPNGFTAKQVWQFAPDGWNSSVPNNLPPRSRWPTADKKRSCPPRALLALASSCGQRRTEAVIRGHNPVALALVRQEPPSELAAYPGQRRTKWRRGSRGARRERREKREQSSVVSWRFDGHALTFHLLGPDGRYTAVAQSRAMPQVAPADLAGLLALRGAMDDNALFRHFQARARQRFGRAGQATP